MSEGLRQREPRYQNRKLLDLAHEAPCMPWGRDPPAAAALLEQFRFIGIEISPEYVEIARLRVRSALPAMFAGAAR